jgi:hypothetical protein
MTGVAWFTHIMVLSYVVHQPMCAGSLLFGFICGIVLSVKHKYYMETLGHSNLFGIHGMVNFAHLLLEQKVHAMQLVVALTTL